MKDLIAELNRVGDARAASFLCVPVETIRAIRNGHEPSARWIATALAILREV